MRYLFIFLGITFASVSNANLQSEQGMLNDALLEYANLNQAYHLNKRCKILKEKDTDNFNKIFSSISIQMHNDIKNTDLLSEVERNAKKTISNKPLNNCGSEVISLIDYAFSHSQKWNTEIMKQDKASSIANDPIINYGTLYGGWMMEKNCQVLNKKDLQDFSKAMKIIYVDLIKNKILTKERFSKFDKEYGYIAQKEPFSSCKKDTERAIRGSMNKAFSWAYKIIEASKETS